jgi:predicted porin
VTLYGVADIGVKNGDSTLVSTAAKPTAAATGLNGTPRIGVKGEEDLGGGLVAYFTFESSVNMATGNNTNADATKAPAFGDRGAFVGVKGSFGAIDAGASRLSPSFYAGAAIDASQTNNYGIFNFGGATRNDTSINYTSNNLGGLVVRASMIMEDNLTTGSSYYDLSGVYTAGALTVAASFADNGTTTGNMIGAAYNLGPATVSASTTQLIADESKAWNVGVRAPMGAWTLSADFGKNKDTSVKSSVVAAQYALSKRSSLTAYAKKVDDKQNEMGFGIRHNF